MSEIKPALTEKEWAGKELPSRDDSYLHVRFGLSGEYENSELLEIVTPADLALGSEDRHALAALALHEQPFGFTWADVDLLRSAADEAQEYARPLTPEGQAEARAPYDSLADRIAALLPPEES